MILGRILEMYIAASNLSSTQVLNTDNDREYFDVVPSNYLTSHGILI